VATTDGVSISTDSGATFTTKTTTNGLGSNFVNEVYAVGSTVYAATGGGLSISTNGGTTFTNKTTSDGLGDNNVTGVYAVGSTVYAATLTGGLSISTDSGATFTTKTTSNGFGSNNVNGVYAAGSTVYAATDARKSDGTGGLSISTNRGASFTNKTVSNGLGDNTVNGVYAAGTTVYAATTGGLSFATVTAHVPVTRCSVSVSALPASTRIARLGLTTLVSRASPSAGCRLVITTAAGAGLSPLGDRAVAKFGVNAVTGRVVVITREVARLPVGVRIKAVPKSGSGRSSTTWVRTWRAR